MRRRAFLKTGATAAGAAAVAGGCAASASQAEPTPAEATPFRQSVCKWPYGDRSVAELAAAAQDTGLASVELLGPSDWPTLAEHGLTCAMTRPPKTPIPAGFNRPENHERLVPLYKKHLRKAADFGAPNTICFSGNRGEDLTDAEGLENCTEGLKQIMPAAEEAGVTVCMELLNSKVDHSGYMCDRTDWGVELVERVGSERFRLLYDIYHMQIMEGDVIRTIQNHHEAFAHYHTAGVPGRHEIDETQELFYPAIMRAIAETGFTGFVGQEFVPTSGDPIASLRAAYETCNVSV